MLGWGGVTESGVRSLPVQVDSLPPFQVNGAHAGSNLRSPAILWRAFGLGRSRILWRSASSPGHLLFLGLTVRGPHQTGRCGTKSASELYRAVRRRIAVP